MLTRQCRVVIPPPTGCSGFFPVTNVSLRPSSSNSTVIVRFLANPPILTMRPTPYCGWRTDIPTAKPSGSSAARAAAPASKSAAGDQAGPLGLAGRRADVRRFACRRRPRRRTPAKRRRSRVRGCSFASSGASAAHDSGGAITVSATPISRRNSLGMLVSDRPRMPRVCGPREIEPLAGPRHADEQQPAFLFVFARIVGAKGPFVRQEILLDSHNIDDGELESLRRMQRHQRDAVGRSVDAVDVGHEGRRFQKSFERRIVPPRRHRIGRPR